MYLAVLSLHFGVRCLVPWPGMEPRPLHLKRGVLILAGQPGKFLNSTSSCTKSIARLIYCRGAKWISVLLSRSAKACTNGMKERSWLPEAEPELRSETELTFMICLCNLDTCDYSLKHTLLLKKKLFISLLFLAVLGLRWCARSFFSCGEWGLLSTCGVRASRCSGYSCCGPQALGTQASVTAVLGLSCPD